MRPKRGKRFFPTVWTLILSVLFAGIGMSTASLKEIPADSPYIQYFGRWDVQDGVYRCGYGATYIRMNFTGTRLAADMEGGSVRWQVSVDGGAFRCLRPQGRDTVLAENLSPGPHRVLFVRLGEGIAGINTIRGFTVDDEAELLPPAPLKKRRLEFVGDSITAGAMNDGQYTGDNYTDVGDNDMAFGPQLARMLDADYSVIAKSGQGVVHNYSEAWPWKGVHAKDSYAWTLFCNEFRPDNRLWDTERFPVDAIVVALGTNDLSDKNCQPFARPFINGYKELLATIRRMNPGKPIICTEPVPEHCGVIARDWIRRAVEERLADGDEKIWFIPLNENGSLLEPADYADGNTHPTKKGSTKIAKYLRDKEVARLLGW
ncbi:MAG: hypothetical protein IJS96_05325 [Schwartzia sp.]|nr:hypothetical protein [Schwartzia sp. (in: firmicutes)]